MYTVFSLPKFRSSYLNTFRPFFTVSNHVTLARAKHTCERPLKLPKRSQFSLVFAFSDLLNSILNLADRTFASLDQSVFTLLLSSQNFSLSLVLTIMTIFQILDHSPNYYHVIKKPRTIFHRIPQ